MRIGIVGSGEIGSSIIRSFQDKDIEVVVVEGLPESKKEEIKERLALKAYPIDVMPSIQIYNSSIGHGHPSARSERRKQKRCKKKRK